MLKIVASKLIHFWGHVMIHSTLCNKVSNRISMQNAFISVERMKKTNRVSYKPSKSWSARIFFIVGWLLVLRPIVSLGNQAYKWSALHGSLSKGSYPVFMRVSDKTAESSERLDRQARPDFEPGTSRLPVLSVTTMPLVGANIFFIELSERWGVPS